MLRPRHVIATVTSLLLLPVLAAGCSDDEKATPQVLFDGNLQTTNEALDTAGGEKNCNESGPLFIVGAFGNPAAEESSQPKKDGESFQQGNVSVRCSVTPAGEGMFNVSGSVSLSGGTGGTFTLRPGTVGASCTDQAPCGNLTATFSKVGGLVYNTQTDIPCTVRYTTPYQGVAAGRLWGEIECPKVINEGAQVACKAVAQFRFENCDQ